MKKAIPYLQAGDKLMIVSPAKSIAPNLVIEAKEFWENQNFQVELGEFCMGHHHYFSGTDEERRFDMQQAIDDPEIKAIICARGGYGSIRIFDLINWSGFIRNPKWLVGFSDITVFHQYLQRSGFESIHATMPLNYATNSPEALKSLTDALTGKLEGYQFPAHENNKFGKASGKLIGGNLSILYSLIGTELQSDYSDSILFIEDLFEQLYHLDRMFYSLEKSGILNRIKGLIVGSFTDMKDTEIPFGKKLHEIILNHMKYRNIPVAFDFPAGHQNDNRALILGREVEFQVDQSTCTLSFSAASITDQEDSEC